MLLMLARPMAAENDSAGGDEGAVAPESCGAYRLAPQPLQPASGPYALL